MKKNIQSVVATLSIVVGLSIAGFAALGNSVKANIPFDFMVGNKLLPAGEYTVSRGSATGTLMIRGRENNKASVFLVQNTSGKVETKAKLVFNRYGQDHFLSQIWDGYTDGNQVPKSKAERKAAKAGRDNIVQNEVEPETVTIVAQAGQ
jgi:hypothetical protein